MKKEFKTLVVSTGLSFDGKSLEEYLNDGWKVQSLTPFHNPSAWILIILEREKI